MLLVKISFWSLNRFNGLPLLSRLCVLQQFCGVLGHTFMEFLKGSGDYCQAQHAAYADEWTAKLAIDLKHLSHRRNPITLAGPGRLPEPATTRPGWGNSTRCTLPLSASAWPESRWNQPCFYFLPFLLFYSKRKGVWFTFPLQVPSFPHLPVAVLLFFFKFLVKALPTLKKFSEVFLFFFFGSCVAEISLEVFFLCLTFPPSLTVYIGVFTLWKTFGLYEKIWFFLLLSRWLEWTDLPLWRSPTKTWGSSLPTIPPMPPWTSSLRWALKACVDIFINSVLWCKKKTTF